MSLLADLVAAGTLRCPACRGTLALGEQAATCAGCGRGFAFANGALDLYGAAAPDVAADPDPEFVRQVAAALHLPETPESLAHVARAVAGTAAAGDDPHHAAEIAELADRLGFADASPLPAPPRARTRLAPRVEWGPCFLEGIVPPGATLLRSIRLRNAGPAALDAAGDPPVHLSYHWRHADGRDAGFEGLRTALPVPLAPGRDLTVIASLATPPAEGDYRLQFQMVQEGVRWLSPRSPEIAVTVSAAAAPPATLPPTGREFDYGGDHHEAVRMLRAWLARHRAGRGLRLLEVGGGIHPSLAGLAREGHEVLALDVSFPMGQLGSLCHEAPEAGRLAFVACDATDPPLAPAAFDGAAVFAAVHHFARPERLLAALARATGPGGFVAVMCEPCRPDPASPGYLRDLAKGINEQAWAPEEWATIFARAGLRVAEGRLDAGSLKAILQRNGPGSP